MSQIGYLYLLIIALTVNESFGLVELTKINYIQELARFNERAVILLHQGWCSESRNFETFLNSVQQQQQGEQNVEMKVNYLQININEEDILADKLPDKGYPSIYLYHKGNYTQYEYDLFSRRQFKYQIDLFFFAKTLNVRSGKSFDEQKQKFQFIFIGNKGQFANVFAAFSELSKEHSLYTFIDSSNYEILNRFFIQREQVNQAASCDSANQSCSQSDNLECSYLIIVRKYDKFDKYLRLCYDNQKSVEKMQTFFEHNQKPYRIYTFNHRVRKYLIERNYYAATLLYRKKIYQDDYISQSFYNITRDIKSILEGKKDDSYNYVTRIKEQIQTQLVFLILDRFENKMTQKIAEYMEDNSFENTPSAFVFRFNSKERTLDKYKFKIKHQDFIVSSEYILFLQNVLHEQSQKHIQFQRSKPIDDNILLYNKKIIQLNSYYFERSYSERYLKMMKKEQIINVILFITQYSRLSLELIPLFSKLQQNIRVPSQIEISFSYFDISENDQQLFEFNTKIKEVPAIRIFHQRNKYQEIDIQPISNLLIKNKESLAFNMLEQQIKDYVNTLLENKHRIDL